MTKDLIERITKANGTGNIKQANNMLLELVEKLMSDVSSLEKKTNSSGMVEKLMSNVSSLEKKVNELEKKQNAPAPKTTTSKPPAKTEIKEGPLDLPKNGTVDTSNVTSMKSAPKKDK